MVTLIGTTGHRPQSMGGFGRESIARIFDLARNCVKKEKERHNGSLKFLTGMALGWDQAIGWACLEEEIPFAAVVPFEGQELHWGEKDREEYWSLRNAAENVVVVGDTSGGVTSALMRRNVWIVDNSHRMTCCWNGKREGGTWQAVRYAIEKGKRPENYFA